ncbi:RimJ/RimL family protein N-acetyltransferase [Salsuginibacillus halophilus]|uniref:RimJ/RimL family protein N-acetyltransferase n=1 Tax=Salsuginibacillus halophilus TaxID=517424 RepID=A0A2P8HAI7_9BACI|nr:GNAT family N-acetyltransferase [Salsuginibacillus halophilus]PSL43210.1 RimJ/RimL family protein N-acetyltransferase [Salsuginibacillus halophilus]
MNIRPIAVSDADEFLAVSKKIDESGFMLYEPEERETTVEQQRKAIEGIMSSKKSVIYVAEVENKIVGFITALGGRLKRNQHSAYLVLGVLEDYQGRGFATKLFEQMFQWAAQVEISRLELTVIKDNVSAFHLYRKMGFVLEGEKVHSLMINGTPMNEYYLYKLL